MYEQFGAVLVFIFLGAAFVFGSLFVGAFVRRRVLGGAKHAVYECGEPTIGTSWIRYNSRFYNIALVFLLFDVEVIVLLPAVLVLRDKVADGDAVVAFVGLLVFIALLALGLAYEWFYGNLDWIRTPREAEQERQQLSSEGAAPGV